MDRSGDTPCFSFFLSFSLFILLVVEGSISVSFLLALALLWRIYTTYTCLSYVYIILDWIWLEWNGLDWT